MCNISRNVEMNKSFMWKFFYYFTTSCFREVIFRQHIEQPDLIMSFHILLCALGCVWVCNMKGWARHDQNVNIINTRCAIARCTRFSYYTFSEPPLLSPSLWVIIAVHNFAFHTKLSHKTFCIYRELMKCNLV